MRIITLIILIAVSCGAGRLMAYTPNGDPNVIFWLDAADSSTLSQDTAGSSAITADGQPVGRWADKSPNGWHVVANGGEAGKPLYKGNQQNGISSIRFDGNSDSMSTQVASLQGSAYTVFVVARRVSQHNLEAMLSIHDGASADWNNTGSVCLGLGYGEILADVRDGQFQSQLSHPGSGVSFMYSTKYDGTNNTAYVNGVGGAPLASAGNFSAETITLGARGASLSDLNGYEYFEVLIFNSALSDEYRQDVENYLGAKYAFSNTQWAPPPPSPPEPPAGPYNPANDSRVVFWLDGADSSTLFQDASGSVPVTADGQPVGSWTDKSASGWDVVANGGDAKPLYKANQQNGISSIRFDGSSDSMSTELASLQGSTYTVFVVARRVAQKNMEALLSIHDGTSLDWDNTGSFCLGLGYGETLTDARHNQLQSQLSHPGSGVSFMYATKYDGTNNTAYVNGIGGAPVVSHGPFSAETITLGARGPSLGDLNRYEYFEVLIYDFAMSDAYRQAVETYLGSKYALPNTQWAPPPPPPPQPPVGPYIPENDSRLVFWLDGTDPSTLFQDANGSVSVTANGQPVGTWLDKSASGWHVVANGGEAGKPIYKATQPNGLSSVRFDGSLDSMSTHLASLQGSSYTVVVVGKRVTHRPFESMLSIHAQGSVDWNDSSSVCVGYSDGHILADARNSVLTGSAIHPGNGVAFMYTTVYDGTNNKVYVNGVAGAPAPSAKRLSSEIITLGARSANLSDHNNYEYFEVLIYDFAFSEGYRQAVENHLGTKYQFHNTQWAPPPPPPPQPPTGPYNPDQDTRLALWLDSADPSTLFQDVSLATPVTTDGQLVGGWKDKSGNDWHMLANAGQTGKPTYKVNQQNGRPSLRFDGNSDSISSLASLGDSAYTVFVVGRRISYRSLESMLSMHGTGQVDWNNAASACVGYSDGKKLADVRNSTLLSQMDHPSAGVTFLYSTKYDGSTNTAYVNGYGGTPTNSTGAFAVDKITLGARGATLSDFNNYEYFEVLIFDFALSDEYRLAVEKYLEQKFALENMAGTVPPTPPAFPPAPAGSYTPQGDAHAIFWLDAADPATLFQNAAGTTAVQADGEPVGLWKDKSAKGWDVSIAGGTDQSRPTYKVDQTNGARVVRFDGIANFLRTTAASLQGSGYTFFVVSKRSAFVNLETMLSIHDAGGQDWENNFSICMGHNVFFEQYQNFLGDCRNDILLSETAHPGDDVTFLYTSKYDGTTNTAYVDGVAGAPTPSSGRFSAETIMLGARSVTLDHFNKYDYFEVLIFDCALSDAYREAVEQYLKTKYSIPSQP